MAPTREAVRESSDRVREAPKQKETRGRGEVSLREELIAMPSFLRAARMISSERPTALASSSALGRRWGSGSWETIRA